MAAKLTVRKELKDTFVDCDFHGASIRVDLATASQEHLTYLKELGADIFETTEKVDKEKK